MVRRFFPVILLVAAPLLMAANQDTKPAKESAKADPLHPRVKMVTTLGEFVLELDGAKAPITVDNFLQYAKDGFYKGTIFHRIVQKGPRVGIDVIQGGGRTADMSLKEGLRKPIKNEWDNGLKNKRGTISMARTRAPDSATSQFFINTDDNQMLDMPRGGAAYAVFGKVVDGMDVVDKIRNTELTTHPKMSRMGKVVPATPVEIKSVTLEGGLTFKKCAEAMKPAIEAAEKAAAAAAAKANAGTAARAASFKKLLESGVDADGNKLQKTESGLQYVIIKAGDGPTPQASDTVEVHYTGWLMNGKEFDSSRKRGRPATFPLNGVIKGWTEGVGLMKVGERRLLIVPPDLGYGARGTPGGPIPPKATLVFDVELLSIK